MKTKNILILTSFAALAFTANALLPKTELQPRWLRVTDVERTDSATRVGIRLQNIPNLPVSSFAKDVLSSYAIGKTRLMIDDIEMNFKFSNGPR